MASAGCQAPERAPSGVGTTEVEPTGAAEVIAADLVVKRRGEAHGSVACADLMPRENEPIAWRVLDPNAAAGDLGATFEWRASPTDRFSATVAIDEGSDQTLYLAGFERDEPRMTASVSHKDSAASVFDPPLVMGEPHLAAGGTVEGDSAMTVLTLDEPPKERERGRGTRRMTFAGVDALSTPLGELECQRVEIEFHAALRFAKATVTTTRWIVPGAGPVAEDRRERIVVLGLIPRESRRVIVRTTPLQEREP